MHIQLLQAGGNPAFSMMLMVGMVAVMYFFMIRPQQKRAKEQKAFGASIGSGEEIVCTSGIHGRISNVNEDGTLKVEISRGVFITMERSAVSMELTAAKRKKASTDLVTTTAA